MAESLPFEPMGLCRFIVDGIRRYMAENDGLCPALIGFNPAQYDELSREPRSWKLMAAEMGGDITGICVDEACTVPYLISEDLRRYEI